MTPRLPASALLLGIAGLLPFAALALATLRPSTPFATSMMTNPALFGLIAYGAVILAFLGGVHWGFALEPAVPAPRERLRLVLGVLPSLIGWVALVTLILAPPEAALGVLILGFAATVLTEQRLARHGLVPGRYMWLRWGLSAVVVAILVTVLVLRLLGANVNF
jgi:hypothetical protein